MRSPSLEQKFLKSTEPTDESAHRFIGRSLSSTRKYTALHHGWAQCSPDYLDLFLVFSDYAPTSYFQFCFSEWMAYYCLQCSSFSPAKALYNDITIHRWQCHCYYLSSHTKMPLSSCLGLFKIKKFLSLEFLNSFKLLPFCVLILTEPYFLALLYELHLRSLQRTGDPKQNRWVIQWETERYRTSV